LKGPLACTRIQFNKGVCGTTWAQRKTIVVPNVHQFPGHIGMKYLYFYIIKFLLLFIVACSSASLSEIVVPILRISSNDEEGQVLGVLDIDSEYEAHFDDVDRYYLEQLVRESIEPCFS
jgi:GAF domain-containing protein